MATGGNPSRFPFEVTMSARVCPCEHPPLECGVRGTLDRAVRLAEGYWAVYYGFFADQVVWIRVEITDRRDGRILWRNGHHLTPGGATHATLDI